jgi:hypothetical protein
MRERHDRASAKQRSELLNEMVAMTGFHRKALIRRMHRAQRPTAGGRPKRRGREGRRSDEDLEVKVATQLATVRFC